MILGSLAFQHGMRDGDALLYVDGHNAASLTHLDVQNLVKQVGASGQLRLTLSRPSPHNQHRPLQRVRLYGVYLLMTRRFVILVPSIFSCYLMQ